LWIKTACAAVKLQKEAMTTRNVTISPELFARVTEEAAAEGTTADEIANEAMKRYLAVRRLDRLQRYGQKRAEELGITEDDVPRLIAESRAERRR
jgi:aldehyde:ferredoxin oxidoreductase